MDTNKDCQRVHKKYEWVVERLEENIPKAKKYLIQKTQQEMQDMDNFLKTL